MISTKGTRNKIRGLAFSAMMLLLLSVIISSQNTFINTAYADHKDDNGNKKIKNKSLINDISDQVINTRSNKESIQNILQLIQTQIVQTSGQDKATKTINLINSIINLNPNGPLAQSLLYLSKQQAIGNINSVNEAAVQVAVNVANGSNEDIGQIIKQAASHTQQVISSQLPSSLTSPSSSPLLLSSPQQSPPPLSRQAPQLLAANNSPPIANAGHSADKTVNEGSLVTLDGSASRDPDGDAMTFVWTQLSGPPVMLSTPNEAKTSFTAPSNLQAGDITISFKLTVADSSGLSNFDTVSILVSHTAISAPAQRQTSQLLAANVTDVPGLSDSTAHNVTVKRSTSVPTTPAPLGGDTDKFGIKELYQSKPGGEEWFMNMDTAKDSRSDPPSLIKNADGSFRVSGQENIRYRIYTSTGYHEPSSTDQKHLAAQGFMLAPNDWKNVEMTGYLKVVQNEPSDNSFTWYARGGHNTSSRGCEGTSIKGILDVDGQTKFAKEQWHTGGYIFTPSKSSIVSSMVGKWIGFKMVTYNLQENGKTVVMMQNWVDKDNNDNWVKVNEYIDRGGLGDQGDHCGGSQDEIITWGGPIATFRWDHFNAVDIKNLSIREIQPPQ
jgi:hypothetical protein